MKLKTLAAFLVYAATERTRERIETAKKNNKTYNEQLVYDVECLIRACGENPDEIITFDSDKRNTDIHL